MDEPTSALDPISTAKIEELATELKKQYTIIIVTHNMHQALRISDDTAFFLLCEQAIALAAQALKEGDVALAGQVSGLERDIDRKERDIENLCLRLLLHQQPVAGDLRQISAALKMITDMERIGDHATNIAEWVEFSVTGVHKEETT